MLYLGGDYFKPLPMIDNVAAFRNKNQSALNCDKKSNPNDARLHIIRKKKCSLILYRLSQGRFYSLDTSFASTYGEHVFFFFFNLVDNFVALITLYCDSDSNGTERDSERERERERVSE